MVVDLELLVEVDHLQELLEQRSLHPPLSRKLREDCTFKQMAIEQHGMEETASRKLREEVDDQLQRALQKAREGV
jgi:hypothetical protein